MRYFICIIMILFLSGCSTQMETEQTEPIDDGVEGIPELDIGKLMEQTEAMPVSDERIIVNGMEIRGMEIPPDRTEFLSSLPDRFAIMYYNQQNFFPHYPLKLNLQFPGSIPEKVEHFDYVMDALLGTPISGIPSELETQEDIKKWYTISDVEPVNTLDLPHRIPSELSSILYSSSFLGIHLICYYEDKTVDFLLIVDY